MNLKDIFPRGSASFIAANPHIVGDKPLKIAPGAILTPMPERRRGRMNNTELEMAFILERMKRADEISDWKFEGITLRWNGVKYTADFAVFPSEFAVNARIKLIEVKGAFYKGKFERAVERFRHARTYWTCFDFELHQRSKDGEWSQIR